MTSNPAYTATLFMGTVCEHGGWQGQKLAGLYWRGCLIHLVIECFVCTGCSLVGIGTNRKSRTLCSHSCRSVHMLLPQVLKFLSLEDPDQPDKPFITAQESIYILTQATSPFTPRWWPGILFEALCTGFPFITVFQGHPWMGSTLSWL